MENETVKSISDTIGKVADLINPTDEVKKAGVPFFKRIAKTFSNKRALKHSELDSKAIILRVWQENLEERVRKYLLEHPDASYNETNEYLLKKQINDSTYSLNNDYMRERFAKLIATTAIDFEDKVTPLFSSVLSNLNPTTAKLFFNLKADPQGLSPMIYYGNNFKAIYSYYQQISNDANSNVRVTRVAQSEITQLVSLGLIAIIDDYKIYDASNPDDDLYLSIKNKAQSLGMNENNIKSYAAIRITDFGESFFQVVYWPTISKIFTSAEHTRQWSL